VNGPPESPVTPRRPIWTALLALLAEIVDPDRDGPLRPSWSQLATFALYVGCAVVYIAIGVWKVDFLLSLWVSIAYLLVTAWLIPAGLRRLL
jgi:hypothetical protein